MEEIWDSALKFSILCLPLDALNLPAVDICPFETSTIIWLSFFVSVNNQNFAFSVVSLRGFFYSTFVPCLHPDFFLCSVVAHTAFRSKYHKNISYSFLAEQEAAGSGLGVGLWPAQGLLGVSVLPCWLCLSLHRNHHLGLPLSAATGF